MSDLISRQDAIDAMMALKAEDDEMYGCSIPESFDGERAVETLRKLPSAEKRTEKRTETHECDYVSRQDAIDAFLTELTKRERKNLLHTWSTVEVKYFVVEMLEQLPSAEPDLDEWCTDCKEYDHEKHSCPRWNRVIRQTVDDWKAERRTDETN